MKFKSRTQTPEPRKTRLPNHTAWFAVHNLGANDTDGIMAHRGARWLQLLWLVCAAPITFDRGLFFFASGRVAAGVRIYGQQLPAVVIHAAVFRRMGAAAAWMA